MPRKKTVADQVGSAIDDSKSPTKFKDFKRKLLNYPDAKEAAKWVAEHAESDWDERYGAEHQRIKVWLKEAEQEYQQSLAEITRLKQERDQTDKFKAVDDPNNRIPVWKWPMKDMFTYVMTLSFMATVMAMGGANVYAILMSSGNPVFLEQPGLAITIAALMPAASYVLKGFTSLIKLDELRKRYTLSIFSLATLTTFIWIILFATTFDGISSGFDMDSLLEADATNTASKWMTACQLLGEFFISAALGIHAANIGAKYGEPRIADNTERAARDQAVHAATPEHKKISDRYADLKGQDAMFEAQKSKFVNEEVAEFYDLRSRQHSLNDL